MRYILLVASALLLASGCQKYRADPLEPAEIFRVIEAQRRPTVPVDAEPSRDPNAAAIPAPKTVFTLQRASGNEPDSAVSARHLFARQCIEVVDDKKPGPCGARQFLPKQHRAAGIRSRREQLMRQRACREENRRITASTSSRLCVILARARQIVGYNQALL